MGKHQKVDFSYWAFQAQKQRASATPKQQGPEGRKSIKIATKNSLM